MSFCDTWRWRRVPPQVNARGQWRSSSTVSRQAAASCARAPAFFRRPTDCSCCRDAVALNLTGNVRRVGSLVLVIEVETMPQLVADEVREFLVRKSQRRPRSRIRELIVDVRHKSSEVRRRSARQQPFGVTLNRDQHARSLPVAANPAQPGRGLARRSGPGSGRHRRNQSVRSETDREGGERGPIVDALPSNALAGEQCGRVPRRLGEVSASTRRVPTPRYRGHPPRSRVRAPRHATTRHQGHRRPEPRHPRPVPS